MRTLGVCALTTFLAAAAVAAEPVPPVSPEQAVGRMKMPPGFRATLVAGEPTLVKPIAMTTDDRGRLWVVESHTYPNWRKLPGDGHDRVLIFEERDGTFGPPKVFLDNGVNLSGIAWGFGGVWLASVPNLWFVPVDPSGDRPAGEHRLVLSGWDVNAKHNVVNDLAWGPDGWLYGCNGILSNSRISAPKGRSEFLNCGVWRYQPTRQVFEVVATGTTNPWGIDWDDYGEIFITNCVIKHLFHVVPGGRYVRMFGDDHHPYSFGLMPSCADHIHWGGGDWTTSRGGHGPHDAAGGGHAHAGALVYLGDNWPDEYRNSILMCNLHGNRLNRDTLERSGSGYVAHHGPDFLFANDPWFRGLCLQASADGGVFVGDWHDTGECHNYDGVRQCGRVFKVTFGAPKSSPSNLAELSDDELIRLQTHKNDWRVRHARRVLQERAASLTLAPGTRKALRRLLGEQSEATKKLRILWALHAVGDAGEGMLRGLLGADSDAVRVWAVRLLAEEMIPSTATMTRLVAVAKKDGSPAVRLALASALRRLPPTRRWELAEALVAHAEDAEDPNLPLMLWYGIEPAVAADPERAAGLLTKSRIPLLRQYIARRLAAMAEDAK